MALTMLDFFPAPFVESLPLSPLSISLNASLIVFDFFQIISFRLPLLILKPLSLSQRSSRPLSHGSVFLSLSHSLPLNAHGIDVFLSTVVPVMLFPPFSSSLCLLPFILSKVLCSVFSPGRLSLMHTDI